MADPMSSSSQLHANMFSEDRLTSLPESLIEAILANLPLRDAVRTSVLSRAWKYEWTNISRLVFDRRSCLHSQMKYDKELKKIVDKVLLRHRGPVVDFMLETYLENGEDIEKWFLYLSEKGIKDIVLVVWNGQRYKVPSCIFSCEEIRHMGVPWDILIPSRFKNLKTLVWFMSFSDNGLQNLVSKWPLLKELRQNRTVGRTRATTLVDLEVVGEFKNSSFEETSLLAKASINLSNNIGEYQRYANGAICKLFESIGPLTRTRRLQLLVDASQIFSTDHVPLILPPRSLLLYMSLTIKFEDIQEVLIALCIFRSSPFLQKLDIECISSENRKGMVFIEDFWKKQDDFRCMLCQLRFVNFTEFTGSPNEMNFVKFVLGNAPVLEFLEIQLKAENMADLLKILIKTLEFRRLSRKARLVTPY